MTEQIVDTNTEAGNQSGESVLAPAQVTDFLRQNPDFFVGRDDLLLKMTLPHRRGSAISLVERQVALLRERVMDYRHQLAHLTENARDNEKLFQRLHLLVLSLLDCNDLVQLVDVISDSLNHEFGIEFHSLILFDQPSLPARSVSVLSVPVRQAVNALGSIMISGKAICGQVTEDKLDFLFQEQAGQIHSVAIIPLNYPLGEPRQLGVLAMGSRDKRHFRASMGTVFISYLGEVLSRILARHLQS